MESICPTGLPRRSRSATMRPYSSPAGPSSGRIGRGPSTVLARERTRAGSDARWAPRKISATLTAVVAIDSRRLARTASFRSASGWPRMRPTRQSVSRIATRVAPRDRPASAVDALDGSRQLLIRAETVQDFQQAASVVPSREAENRVRKGLLPLLDSLEGAVGLLGHRDGFVGHHTYDGFNTHKCIDLRSSLARGYVVGMAADFESCVPRIPTTRDGSRPHNRSRQGYEPARIRTLAKQDSAGVYVRLGGSCASRIRAHRALSANRRSETAFPTRAG